MKAGLIIWKQIPLMTKMACGARQATLIREGKGVQFRVTNKPMRYVEVVLDECTDLYNITYARVKRSSYEHVVLGSVKGIFAEDMGEVIYRMVNQ